MTDIVRKYVATSASSMGRGLNFSHDFARHHKTLFTLKCLNWLTRLGWAEKTGAVMCGDIVSPASFWVHLPMEMPLNNGFFWYLG